MNKESIKNSLIDSISDLNEQKALSIIRTRLKKGADPLQVVADCQSALCIVGERYERQEYFLSGLVMAGEIFREAMKLINPIVKDRMKGKISGNILLGTVEGDIHDIGKDMAGELMNCHGMSVHDLGVNVPPHRFSEEATRLRPDIIGISILISNSMGHLRKTIGLLRSNPRGPTSKIPVIIGGGILDDEYCRFVGADYWVNDAMEGVRICQRLLAS
jgi:methanogenic corrinoid protein MtbC1